MISKKKEKKIKLILLIAILIVLDQASKYLAINSSNTPVYVNQGVSFGVLPGGLWVWINLVILITVGYFLIKRNSIALEFILAGGVSNFIDRIAYGGVVDWIKIPLAPWRNNLADIWITLGVILLIFSFRASGTRQEKKLKLNY